MTADHPRSRGEYSGTCSRYNEFDGSSPLSRGIPRNVQVLLILTRIIPALAGNTSRKHDAETPHPDHPRSRGEYQSVIPQQRLRPRIIPALAGNTWVWRSSTSLWRDHPRSRGEYGNAIACLIYALGSSPLSRGIQIHTRCGKYIQGIIPALAGNTDSTKATTSNCPDHPRSRGEYVTVIGERNHICGSSPLSRGIHSAPKQLFATSRIIPALAGNTTTGLGTAGGRRDHPRSRGEYAQAARTVGSL